MLRPSFQELSTTTSAAGKFLCVGLDPDAAKLSAAGNPDNLMMRMQQFLTQIVDATAHLAAAFKANVAFYEEFGAEGLRVLAWICRYIKEKYPGILLIIDAKRADVKNTSMHSANFLFGHCQADAVTVNPFLGEEDALEPYLSRADKGVLVLCRTSNKGAARFQDRLVLGAGGTHQPLYRVIAEDVASDWNTNNNCGLVVGATAPTQLELVREIAPRLPLLIPGIGKQGGDLEKAVRAARFQDSLGGFWINSSSGILHPTEGKFPDNSIVVAEKLHTDIRRIMAT
jgi:orotidine-5'-phosphate decarboxylase